MTHHPDQPLFTITTAVIPNADNPKLCVCGPDGRPPSFVHENYGGTWEEGLYKFSRGVVGCCVSVERRATELETGGVGHIAYQTKPVHPVRPLPGSYEWKAIETQP